MSRGRNKLNTLKKPLVLIMGPYPPPSGGVSIHIKRLASILKGDFDLDFIDEAKIEKPGIFNLRSFNIGQYIKKIWNADVLFIHSGSSALKIVHILFGKVFGKEIILTIHSYHGKSDLKKAVDRIFFNLSTKIIIVNSNIQERLRLKQGKYLVMNAFLPPIMSDEPELPDWITEWISNQKEKGKQIICANAWRLEVFNNEDLYGLDLCISVTNRLIEKGIKAAFIFVISSDSSLDPTYHHHVSVIEKLNIKDSFLLVNENLSFVKLIERSDIVVRPTNTDGDALTIREGLYLGKPVIASDVVNRPEGTILFKNRDEADLEKQLEHIINMISNNETIAKGSHLIDFSKFYTELIKSIV